MYQIYFRVVKMATPGLAATVTTLIPHMCKSMYCYKIITAKRSNNVLSQ